MLKAHALLNPWVGAERRRNTWRREREYLEKKRGCRRRTGCKTRRCGLCRYGCGGEGGGGGEGPAL